MRYLALLVGMMVVVICGQGASAQRRQVLEIPIAEGRRISVAVMDGGPVPAENERLKIEIAGMVVSAAQDSQPGPALIWNFSFRVKDGASLGAVAVDDVTADPIAVMVNDNAPVLQNGTWGGRARPLLINARDLPWLYEPKPTIKVFRFTVRHADGEVSVLHQLAWFPVPTKNVIREHAEKVRPGG